MLISLGLPYPATVCISTWPIRTCIPTCRILFKLVNLNATRSAALSQKADTIYCWDDTIWYESKSYRWCVGYINSFKLQNKIR